MKKLTLSISVITLLTLCSFDIPTGWFAAGSKPKSYDMGTAIGEGRDGKNCAIIKSKEKKIKGFGTLMQYANPEEFIGKRVRMSGYLKTKDVDGWAGLWFRIDEKSKKGKDKSTLDNMWRRRLKGTNEWRKYELVLDVPVEATNIAFGALLDGTGQIWFDEINFEIVDSTIKTTNSF